MSDQFLTPTEVAKRLGVSRATMHAILKRGEITYRQYGPRTIRIDEGEMQKYIDRHTKVSGNGKKEPERDEHGDEIIEW